MTQAYLLTSEEEIAARLWSLRPRDGDFLTVEVAVPGLALPVLRAMPASLRLLAGALAGPRLWEAAQAAWGADAEARALAGLFREPFPPALAIPALQAPLAQEVEALALGGPGEPVAHGLFPSRVAKLARLALARSGIYPAELVLRAAGAAYGAQRSHLRRSYHAHDAVACALVHPAVDARGLLAEYARHTRGQRGWRSRRKTHRLLAWARRSGYL